jgi:hypothetical protein
LDKRRYNKARAPGLRSAGEDHCLEGENFKRRRREHL